MLSASGASMIQCHQPITMRPNISGLTSCRNGRKFIFVKIAVTGMLSIPSGAKKRGDEMTEFSDEIDRPFLKYFGGAWTRAPWIIDHFIPHKGYYEPCVGAGSVLFRKKPVSFELANDIDGRLFNAFTVLREQTNELIRAINMTLWHPAEFKKALEPSEDPLEDARRFFFACWASVPGGPNMGASDFRITRSTNRGKSPVQDIRGIDHLLLEMSKRLENVMFTQEHAILGLSKIVLNESDWLIYFDPPYLHETRSNKSGYNHEFSRVEHIEAAELLIMHAGPVVVSGYKSELYTELYEGLGWQRVDRDQQANSGKIATESIWLNPLLWRELTKVRARQPRLFDF